MLRFFLISLVLHGLVIGTWYQLGSSARAVPADMPLSVVLQRAGANGASLPARPLEAPVEASAALPLPVEQPSRPRHEAMPMTARPAQRELPPALPPATAQVAAAPQEPVAAPESVTADTQRAPTLDHAAATSRLVTLATHALEAHFRYPRRARRNGWEGTVTLVLQVQPNGQLTDIQVAGSSGIAVLDRAALASAQAITRLPREQDPRAQAHPLKITLPVQYRLMEG